MRVSWPSSRSIQPFLRGSQTWPTDRQTDTHTHHATPSTSIGCIYLLLRCVIIRLDDKLQPNIGFTLRRVLAVFTRSAITPMKVNRFGWNLEHSEYIVGGWPWRILGAIRAVATAGQPGEIFCQVSNARFHRFPVGQISRNLNTTRRSLSRWKIVRGHFFQKTQKFLKKI